MSIPVADRETIEKIQAAPDDVTDGKLADQLGIHRHTVRKYRKQGRDERRAVTARVIESRIEAEIPSALDGLAFVLTQSRKNFEATNEVPHGRLLMDAAVSLIRYGGVAQEKDPLDGVADAELIEEALRRAGRLIGG